MQRMIKKITVCLMAAFIIMTALVPVTAQRTFASSGAFTVTKVALYPETITQASPFNITVTFNSEMPATVTDVVKKYGDDFVNGTLSNGSISNTNGNKTHSFVYEGLQYDGSGSSLEFKIEYTVGTSTDVYYEDMNVNLSHYITSGTSEPEISVTTGYLAAIYGGKTFNINVTFTNTSSEYDLENIVAVAVPEGQIAINGEPNTKSYSKIAKGDTKTWTIPMKAADTITSNSQSVSFSIKFEYVDGKTRKTGTSESIVSITSAITESTYEEPTSIAEPTAMFSRGDAASATAIKAGETQTITVVVENMGTTAMKNPVISFQTSDDIMVTGGQSSYKLSNIYAGGKTTVKVPVTAAATIEGGMQYLQCELSFSYENGSGTSQGSASGKINIPSQVKEASGAPSIIISDFDYGEGRITKNESFDLEVTFKNTSNEYKLENIMAVITPSGEIAIDGASNTKHYEKLAAGGTATFTVPMKAAKAIASNSQTVTYAFTFDYIDGKTRKSGESSVTIALPSKPTSEAADGSVATPYVIVSGYDYGGESVAAGNEFDLKIKFKNTSKSTAIENVVVTVSGGADLIMNGSANTFYFDGLQAGGTGTVIIPFKLVKNITTLAQTVNMDVKYEYVDSNQRNQVTNNLTVSVPCYTPDRLEIEQPKFDWEPTVYEEIAFTMQYVNKGASALSNFEATVEGDFACSVPTQRVGTIDAGKSGTLAFSVSPQMEGLNHLKVTVSYEDANGDLVERVFEQDVNAMAQPEWEDPGTDEPVEPQKTLPGWLIPAIIVVVIVGAIIALRMAKKKKKAKAEQAKWDNIDLDKELGDN